MEGVVIMFEIVGIARSFIEGVGGFERFVEWGLVR